MPPSRLQDDATEQYRKLQRCAAAQHAMLRGCCVHVACDMTLYGLAPRVQEAYYSVHVAYDETHATL